MPQDSSYAHSHLILRRSQEDSDFGVVESSVKRPRANKYYLTSHQFLVICLSPSHNHGQYVCGHRGIYLMHITVDFSENYYYNKHYFLKSVHALQWPFLLFFKQIQLQIQSESLFTSLVTVQLFNCFSFGTNKQRAPFSLNNTRASCQ